MATIKILGSGTSTGVPQIGCKCETCTSVDPRDRRLRASALVEIEDKNILIDCGPDFRQQMIAAGAPRLDALLITHIHYDHVGGLDDLRPYCHGKPFPIYCRRDVADDIRARMPYCFVEHPYLGVPTFDIHIIEPGVPFEVEGVMVEPIEVMHGKLPILGFRIGSMAYITDCKTMPESSLQQIKNLDLLVINALRHEPHPSHLALSETLEIVRKAAPRRAVLTHMSHQIGPHARVTPTLPTNVCLASDSLVLPFPNP